MQVKVGTFTGDGNTGHAITGIGFQPDAVIIKVVSQRWQMSTSSMGANQTKPMTDGEALYSNGVTSLDVDGFTVGSNAQVNNSGIACYYIALRDNGAGDLKVTSYVGDGVNPHAITGIGFSPNLILFAPADGNTPGFRTSDMPTDSYFRPEDFGSLGDRVESIDADGFTLNSTNEVNHLATTYHVVCLKNTANLFKVMTYTGNGADDRTLTGVGFQPEASFVRNGGGAQIVVSRFKDEVGDASMFVTIAAEAANRIQAFTSDGIQVGTDGAVNTNAVTYYSFHFLTTQAAVASAKNIFMTTNTKFFGS